MTTHGVVRVPGDKSISHRALILGALASGESRISGLLDSADTRSTASALRALGAQVPELTSRMRFNGRGLRGLSAAAGDLDCGNSGTTVRLLAGVTAAHPFASRFTGDASLSRRPMKRIAEPLSAMGADVEFERDDGLPMTIRGGRLAGVAWNTRGASAQTKSAILFAGLCGRVQVSVMEARRSRDHTERMLASLGAPLNVENNTVTLSPVDSIGPLDLAVPADPSSAAYFVALGVLGVAREVVMPDVCLNPTRIGFVETLKAMGADIECRDKTASAGDSVATVIARPSTLRSIIIAGEAVPAMIDELPLLACVAAAAGIDIEVRGAGELRFKESDRLAVVVSNLRALGAAAHELDDGFRVNAGSGRLAGRVTTHGDHRIAMSFGVLSRLAGNAIEIDDADCVAVSYPRFWDDLDALIR